MTGSGVKEAAMAIVRELPPESSWDDLIELIYERAQLEEGIRAIREGDFLTTAEVRRRFGLAT